MSPMWILITAIVEFFLGVCIHCFLILLRNKFKKILEKNIEVVM